MTVRALDHLKFWLERFLLKGPQYRLLFIIAVIGILSVAAGTLVRGEFSSFSDAIWWAFLRLSDPGYLGDDEGVFVRGVSTLLTVTGYVVFLGSLVAIMTQWLNATMARLESGLTPVTRNDHVVILGWTNRTVAIVEELLLSQGRVRRFLKLHGARDLHIVILCEEVTPSLRQDLREQLGSLWDEKRITLRSGNPLRVEHLERVDFLNAAVILLPGSDLTALPGAGFDTRTIKTLLSISAAAEAEGADSPPLLVAEVFDARKLPVARRAYRGPIELIASDTAIVRLIAQNLRHPGLSFVYTELLSQGSGNEIYLPDGSPFVGAPWEEASGAFPGGVVLGVVRTVDSRVQPYLNPPPGFRIEAGDRVIVMAKSSAESDPILGPPPPSPLAGDMEWGPQLAPPVGQRHRRVLVLGWSQKVAALLREFSTYPDTTFEVDHFGSTPIETRETTLRRLGLLNLERVRVRLLEGDYTVPSELLAVDPLGYDHIVLLGSDWVPSDEESDARTILGALLLQELSSRDKGSATIVAELMDPENVSLLNRGGIEVLVTPVLISHVLAQVALRRELRVVFDELFTAGGAEIVFRPPADYGLTGEATFDEIRRAAWRHGEVALGVQLPPRQDPSPLPLEVGGQRPSLPGALHLNPDRTRRWELGSGFRVAALTTEDGS